MPELRIILALGQKSLAALTGKVSLEKWHTSPLVPRDSELRCRKIIATFPPFRIEAQPELMVFWQRTFARAREECATREFVPIPERFLLNPPYEQTMDTLSDIRKYEWLSVDIETGRGQINTTGFAWSPYDAIAINTLDKRLSEDKFHRLWLSIAELLEGPQKKILQNNIFEQQMFSHYGIRMQGVAHDTMWAQKFLWPEFKMGLDNVARFYTNRPYWKDDGKTSVEGEANRKSWDNVRDWDKHYIYNCRDTTGTFDAAFAQIANLKARGIYEVYRRLVARLAEPIHEMCSNGLLVNEAKRIQLRDQTEKEIEELNKQLPEGFNPRSPKQKLELLTSRGYKIPKIRVKGKYQESTNELSIKKLRLTHPEDKDLAVLLSLAKKQKALSSYINFEYDRDGKMRYSLKGIGTETGRMAGGTDCFGKGINPQTLPKKYKCIYDAPPGYRFLNIDLKQAESRYVAYACADYDLITMLEDPAKDIHKYVAAEIFQKPESEITFDERQLGKKSGHGANYDMGPDTFAESCLKEMDKVLSKKEAKNVLESYHRLFPGIRRGHAEIRAELRINRRLTNPLGRERYFYGRLDQNTFREAYAFSPQSTIPDITNCLLFRLHDERNASNLNFKLLLQVHDSLLLLVRPEDEEGVCTFASRTELWHPEIRIRHKPRRTTMKEAEIEKMVREEVNLLVERNRKEIFLRVQARIRAEKKKKQEGAESEQT
jgi:DNA polymerase I-like protein with 3'-5' exonuclease and polymerase domains